MKAIRIHDYGSAEVLKHETAPTPQPGQGEALVRIEAAGLNFIDVYHRLGRYPLPLPFTPGVEGAGVVEGVGPGVSQLKPGDRVAYAMQPGTYAEYALVPAWKAVPIPEGVTNEQAAAVMLQGTTAHYLSHSTYSLGEGDTALVHAAAGGTGQLLVQMAKQRGARVIGTCSTEEKAALARAAGADEVILYTQEDFVAAVKGLTEGRGVDVIYDAVGQTTFLKGLDCLRPRGYMVLFGAASGPAEPIDPQMLNPKGSLFLTRPSLGHYLADREEILARTGDIFGWLASGQIQVRIDQRFPLAEAAEAHRYLEGRQTKGKVLLIP
ncbi:MAG TPA: quinone oxidoreductase [Anaerolineae bacterium]|jgi:NADPH2:quinone reductase|nr:quinone oxidoreductase [Anaerolineae bacterium]